MQTFIHFKHGAQRPQFRGDSWKPDHQWDVALPPGMSSHDIIKEALEGGFAQGVPYGCPKCGRGPDEASIFFKKDEPVEAETDDFDEDDEEEDVFETGPPRRKRLTPLAQQRIANADLREELRRVKQDNVSLTAELKSTRELLKASQEKKSELLAQNSAMWDRNHQLHARIARMKRGMNDMIREADSLSVMK